MENLYKSGILKEVIRCSFRKYHPVIYVFTSSDKRSTYSLRLYQPGFSGPSIEKNGN